jgi:hypothetical protein
VDLTGFDALATSFDGVRRSRQDGLQRWQRNGRLVARQLDDAHVAVRADFDTRAVLLQQFPGTFSVPRRFEKHMMVVADLERGDPDAIADAVASAWRLQAEPG